MKKLRYILLFVFLLSLSNSYAEVIKRRANSFAYKAYNERTGRWGNWSDWERSSILIVIDTDRDVINIYSEKTQNYDIIQFCGTGYNDGHKTSEYACIDADGLRCHIRFVDNDGTFQLYVDYNDFMFVYCLN